MKIRMSLLLLGVLLFLRMVVTTTGHTATPVAETPRGVFGVAASVFQTSTPVSIPVPASSPGTGVIPFGKGHRADPVPGMNITASFDTTNCDYWGNQPGCQHLGTDIANPSGTPVYAPFDGTWLSNGEYFPGNPTCPRCIGQYTRYRTSGGCTMYQGHIMDMISKPEGAPVLAGEQVGVITNKIDGPHSHWQCQDAAGALIDCMRIYNNPADPCIS